MMRPRIIPGLLAAAVATVAAVAVASVSARADARTVPGGRAARAGGQTMPTVAESGYVASGRSFRYAQSVITVPGRTCFRSPGQPRLYVALASRGGFARAGILCAARPVRRARPAAHPAAHPAGHPASLPASLPASGHAAFGGLGQWTAFVQVSDRKLAVPLLGTFRLSGMHPGDGVFASVYFNRAHGSVHFMITMPDGTTFNRTFAVTGPAYTQAEALADWSSSLSPVRPAGKSRAVQFLSGGFTTVKGQPGTFRGPWKLNPWAVTSNGSAPPLGALVSVPSYLWTDGTQPVLGSRGNAFGVWLYP